MRTAIELLASALAGFGALAFPVLTRSAKRGYDAAFLPFMRDVAEGVNGPALLLLLGVGVVGGRFGRAAPALLGFAAAATLPAWSAIDFIMGGEGHKLLPIEWFMYGVYGLVGTAGAIIGRNRGLGKRPHQASDAG